MAYNTKQRLYNVKQLYTSPQLSDLINPIEYLNIVEHSWMQLGKDRFSVENKIKKLSLKKMGIYFTRNLMQSMHRRLPA